MSFSGSTKVVILRIETRHFEGQKLSYGGLLMSFYKSKDVIGGAKYDICWV